MVINMLHQHWNPLGSVRKKTQVHINVPVLMMMMMFILWASKIGLNWNEKRKNWAVLFTWHCTCIYCKEILHIIISCMFYWLERYNNYFLNYFLFLPLKISQSDLKSSSYMVSSIICRWCFCKGIFSMSC